MATEQVGESRDVGTLLQGERQVLEMIAAGAPLAAVLDALCCVIDQRSALMSAVFLVDGDGTRLTQAAGPHLPEEWRRATISLLLTPAMTSCGAAVTLGEQVIVPDVISDPRCSRCSGNRPAPPASVLRGRRRSMPGIAASSGPSRCSARPRARRASWICNSSSVRPIWRALRSSDITRKQGWTPRSASGARSRAD